MFYIYRLEAPNGKYYIGMTKNLKSRLLVYRKLRCVNQTMIFNSIKKYGWDSFNVKILNIFRDKKSCVNKEKELIAIYKNLNISLNISDGGEWFSLIGKNNPKSKEVYQFNSNGILIKKWNSIGDAERMTNISVSGISHACTAKTFYSKGYYWCFEGDLNNIKFNRKIGKSGRCVLQCDMNFNILNTFNSAIEASKLSGINYYGIINCLYMKVKSYNDFYWIYKDLFSDEIKLKINDLKEQELPKRGLKIYRIINGKKELFNSISEAARICRIGKLKIKNDLNNINTINIWKYEK